MLETSLEFYPVFAYGITTINNKGVVALLCIPNDATKLQDRQYSISSF